ncbi:hypothetical protein GCM10010341_69980 [Streptomyces noursei]|nr:hypothetical protein GCM10010341_69980 [Streptomyces noursei]
MWERSGPDAVREILAMDHLPASLRRRTEELPTTPDGPEGLRCQLAEAESPAALTAYLTAPAGRPDERLRRLRSEGLTPPWEALNAAHDAGTLPEHLLSALWELRDCPRPLLLAGLKTLPVWGAEWIRRSARRRVRRDRAAAARPGRGAHPGASGHERRRLGALPPAAADLRREPPRTPDEGRHPDTAADMTALHAVVGTGARLRPGARPRRTAGRTA